LVKSSKANGDGFRPRDQDLRGAPRFFQA